jgi:hypothetical protein
MKYLKGFLNLLLVSMIITAVFFPVAVFVHEGTHYIMLTLEGIQVTSFHVLDRDSLEKGACGYITASKESRYGNLFQEGVAYCIQFLFMVTTLVFCLVSPLKPFTVRQLELMESRKNSHHFSISSC